MGEIEKTTSHTRDQGKLVEYLDNYLDDSDQRLLCCALFSRLPDVFEMVYRSKNNLQHVHAIGQRVKQAFVTAERHAFGWATTSDMDKLRIKVELDALELAERRKESIGEFAVPLTSTEYYAQEKIRLLYIAACDIANLVKSALRVECETMQFLRSVVAIEACDFGTEGYFDRVSSKTFQFDVVKRIKEQREFIELFMTPDSTKQIHNPEVYIPIKPSKASKKLINEWLLTWLTRRTDDKAIRVKLADKLQTCCVPFESCAIIRDTKDWYPGMWPMAPEYFEE